MILPQDEDAEEFYRLLDGVVIDNAQVFHGKLQEREDCYNTIAPRQPGRLDAL